MPGPHFQCVFVFNDPEARAAEVVKTFLNDEETQRLIRARRVGGEVLDLVSRHGVAELNDLDADLLAWAASPWPRR